MSKRFTPPPQFFDFLMRSKLDYIVFYDEATSELELFVFKREDRDKCYLEMRGNKYYPNTGERFVPKFSVRVTSQEINDAKDLDLFCEAIKLELMFS